MLDNKFNLFKIILLNNVVILITRFKINYKDLYNVFLLFSISII